MPLFIIFICLVFVYVILSGRLERTVITAPILFTLTGILIVTFFPDLLELATGISNFLLLAEIGLVMTLFTDATQVNLKILRSNSYLPVRLLGIGMLLTILLGAVAALLIFDKISIWEAGILAAILAPTDAGLGQVIVTSPKVPLRIRQVLNVEAGLNDGLSVPFMMFFIALASKGTEGAGSVLSRFVIEQLGYGALIGIGLGLAGGWLLGLARKKKWMSESLQQIGLVVIPVLSIVLSEPVGASMFIVAFVAGLAVQVGFRNAEKNSIEFTEGWGQVFNYLVFFLFGLFIARDWHSFTFPVVLYAILSLTVIRMLPVALALIGTKLSSATQLFMGWFGPRGLASIVLGLVYLEESAVLPSESTIRLTVMMTVLISVFAHGLTAKPGINWYVKKIARLPEGTLDD
jgi:NhaP-type Na+/H+ or K+/H+ antiporter